LPAEGIEPAVLAPTNYLDQFAQPRLNSTIFTVVGYGTEVRQPEAGPQKPQPMSYPLIRRYTTSPGQKLTPLILQMNGNPNDTRVAAGLASVTPVGRCSSTGTSLPSPATATPPTAATSVAISASTFPWLRSFWARCWPRHSGTLPASLDSGPGRP